MFGMTDINVMVNGTKIETVTRRVYSDTEGNKVNYAGQTYIVQGTFPNLYIDRTKHFAAQFNDGFDGEANKMGTLGPGCGL